MIVKIFSAHGGDAASDIEQKISAWTQSEGRQGRHWIASQINTAATAIGEETDRYTHLIVTVLFKLP